MRAVLEMAYAFACICTGTGVDTRTHPRARIQHIPLTAACAASTVAELWAVCEGISEDGTARGRVLVVEKPLLLLFVHES